ncbi:ATP-dependent RNA helicase rhle-related protein [Babesia gibsoni]|uniref:ATP-dependent RNA helicase rhle-related protein n=1 Tax=Babesia gibsoni TaxID=33632 RepID=A0AAD8PGR7_BABGI|nr:ATP-dependent RNA helicase rhle-related protein [Babesia gibsoni]
MKGDSQITSASDDDQDISIEFQDGFFDGLDENIVSTKDGKEKRTERAKDEDPDGEGGQKQKKEIKRDTLGLKHLITTANWSDFGISRALLKAIFEMGYESPSIIQKSVIPVALEGKDILATAETGSGKSAAFIIPTLQRLINAGVIRQKDGSSHAPKVGTKALILLPTRELAAQCFETFLSLTKYLNQNGVLLTGGVPTKEQEAKMKRVPYIVFATPGKVLDILLNSKFIHMDAIEIVVLDEADRLLDLGFKDELLQILKFCNKDRQTMLFSATLTEATKDLVPISLVNPIYIKATAEITVAKTLKMEMMQIPSDELREAAALYMCKQRYTKRTILFFQTKRAAHRAAIIFSLSGLKCGELHGDLSQSKRFECVERFKNDEVNFLMASELASRGLDIPGVIAVINVHVPTDVVRFVHRVGRTARMGEEGIAITFYVDKERSIVKSMFKTAAAGDSKFEKNKVKLSNAALKNYKSKIDDLEEKIKEIMLEEQVEKEMKKAEDVLKRGRNAEPQEPRVWFRSKKDKKAASKSELQQTMMRAIGSPKEDNDHESSKFHKRVNPKAISKGSIKRKGMPKKVGTKVKGPRRGMT